MKHFTKRKNKYQNRKTQKKYIGGSNDLPETIAIKNALLKCDSSDVDEDDDKYKSLFASLKGQKMRQALWDELATKGFLSVEPIKPTQTSGLNKESIIKLLYCLKYNPIIKTISVETNDTVDPEPIQEPETINELELDIESEIVSDEDDIVEEEVSDSETNIDEMDDFNLNINIANEEKDIPLDEMKRITDQYKFLYPSLDDNEFNKKIAMKKEFSATQYNGKQEKSVKDISNDMCEQEFELMPHQNFVKNFLSYQTPYNALLLYHGLGTGKTCSAIGIAEEMREYMRQIGMSSKIFIVASPNVQDNFRLQLFDERKLVQTGDIWSLNNCVGNKLIKEVNPYATKGVTKDILKTKIRNIIRENYRFIGYTQLANHIIRRVGTLASDEEPSRKEIQLIKKYFNNKLFIIDEFHNISVSDTNKEKKRIGSLLMKIAKYSDNMRLLLLSATPIYNSPKEVVWFTNLLNSIDKRKPIKEKYIFDKDDNFLLETHKDTNMTGEEYLKSKLTGYVSYVRGENPYTFPFRVYPKEFPGVLSEAENNIQPDNYPSKQLNGRDIEEGIQDFPTYITKMDENSYQEKGYKLILDALQLRSANYDKYGKEREMPDFSNMEAFGYTYLQRPL